MSAIAVIAAILQAPRARPMPVLVWSDLRSRTSQAGLEATQDDPSWRVQCAGFQPVAVIDRHRFEAEAASASRASPLLRVWRSTPHARPM